MTGIDTHSPLHQAAKSQPNAIAISWHKGGVKHQLDYQTLSQSVVAVGEQLLAAGLTRGDRLACIDNNSVELIKLYWACIDQGLLFCPLSPRFPASQINLLIEQYHLKAIWSAEPNKDLLGCEAIAVDFSKLALSKRVDLQAKSIDIHQAANIILTSGSSGNPKAAVHSLSNHIASAEGSRMLISLQSQDRWLLTLPLFHIGGLAIINRCALACATVVLENKTTQISEQVQQDEITHLSLVSTQLVRILNQDPSSLVKVKALLLGGGAISASLISKLKQLRVTSYTSYGMTEMGSQITTGIAKADASSGKLLANRRLKILDSHILVKGETLFLGYLKPYATDRKQIELTLDSDGWFNTKDRGEWNANGDLKILGRSDNMFICGGENVQPEEIEAILKQHPQVEDAILFPQADEEFGNLPAAIIKGKVFAQSELDALVCKHAARFKRPRHYFPWPEMKSNSLKVSRKQVIEEVLKS
ncbi:o-succinylbenzoate--CoA ligase [Shewanella eurypsychrophilus]|uniref:O-succinylbenzoate--CoA ligase n=1 Tax=Shewanella eurypsychrophilus TaxID=2593656 RepID=A0ABX6V0Q2_9GAMM|nr:MULTISPECIES: o-succinylbenzoate--CoA ligase [Shewanella]QFU20633.1 o-succinylbenzoate--CoA ligase [Shewanella sp. YLB-09]QFU20913.1 o-succinylbenzoate--CoA ligase [Shewanella sp. YLB-09]QPG56201.2 o-succinylbenzoate--CoA ligase [Shewanella eurypsychrophilus]